MSVCISSRHFLLFLFTYRDSTTHANTHTHTHTLSTSSTLANAVCGDNDDLKEEISIHIYEVKWQKAKLTKTMWLRGQQGPGHALDTFYLTHACVTILVTQQHDLHTGYVVTQCQYTTTKSSQLPNGSHHNRIHTTRQSRATTSNQSIAVQFWPPKHQLVPF